ncbi:MAG: deoxyribose-phosphate aldolase [Bacteroidota bacterium]
MHITDYIDHTLLKPTATETQIQMLCEEAIAYGFKAVCVNGCWVKLASELLKDAKVKVATVIGFPLGSMTTEAKVAEAKDALENGVDEVDMVLNLGWLKSQQYGKVQNDIAQVKRAVGRKVLKVILETGYLTDEEKEKACELAVAAKADYVKTSTGFGTGGATFEDVLLMKAVVGDRALIKASGGVKDRETALRFISLGVSRIGTSSGVKLVTE